MKPNRAFIFDMDGVLIDSERTWVKFDTGFLIEVFGKDIAEKMGSTIGMSVNSVHEKAVSLGSNVDKSKLVDIYDKKAHFVYSESEITEDIDDLIKELDTLGFKLALVSSSRQNWIDKVLPRLSFKDKLDCIISVNDRSDLKPKPSPEAYLEAIRKLGASSETTIILEDSNTGIKAAKAAGAYVIGFRKNLVDGYKQEGADIYADHVSDIIKIVKEKFAIEFASQKFKEEGIGNHFLDVLNILQNEFGVDDTDLLVSAVLHDTLEDTDTTYEELEQVFSKTVAELVQEVSHPKDYNKAQKTEYYENLKQISPKAKILKLADFASNLRAIIKIRKSEPEKPYHDQYITLIRSFLESCPESGAKEVVYELTKELERYVTHKFIP